MPELSGTLFWWWTSIWNLALASHLKFTAYLFGHGATKHKLLSLNVRGIRSFGRRKSNFNWLLNSSADICFVQETYSIQEVGISIQNFKLCNLYKRETLFNWCSRIAKLLLSALSVKKKRNASSIYSSSAGYLLTFGNMSCPG